MPPRGSPRLCRSESPTGRESSSLTGQLKKRLARAHRLLDDFVGELPENLLSSKLSDLPSNTIGQQLWCVVGARTSYLQAAKAGSWQGFSCPLDGDSINIKKDVAASLNQTFGDIDKYLDEADEMTSVQEDFLWDLLEHEIQHHGQLIRYMYGLKQGAPQSWKDRYNLD